MGGSLSRAVRTPSRADDDSSAKQLIIPPGTPQNPGPLPVVARFEGNRDFVSEELIAYEIGYRINPIDRLSIDIAAFYSVYDDLRTVEPGMRVVDLTSDPPQVVQPLTLDNKLEGDAYGVELALEWKPLDWWRLDLAYTYLNLGFDLDRDSQSRSSGDGDGSSPHHQVSLRSSIELPWNLTSDVWLRYVDALPALHIDHYITLDIRLAWQPLQAFEFALVGQNLLDRHHSEFEQEIFPSPTEIERGVYGMVRWRF